ncbi:MAG: TrmB family transcriptional regulator [Candidatus Hermodarchaeota archaeon]
MSLTEPAAKLRQLGLTEYETQAYLILVQGSQMSAEEIARKANIPIPRVYGVLESLKNLGLIVIIEGRPKKFEIISPEEGLQNLLAIRKQASEESFRQLEETSQEVKEVLSPIFWRERLRIRPEDLLESLDNLAITEKQTKQLIVEAEKSLDIFTDVFSWFDGVEKELAKAMKRGVRIRVLMNMQHPTTRSAVKKLLSLGISVRQPSDLRFPVRGTLADSAKVVFLIWASPGVEKSQPRYVYRPSHSANEGIVAIFQQSFEYRWQKSKTRKPVE